MTIATAGEKKDEKLEKRRALGRGLESLLPGPRSIPGNQPRVPDTGRGTGNDIGPRVNTAAANPGPRPFEVETERPHPAVVVSKDNSALEVTSPQSQAATGHLVVNLEIDRIEKNPYQTRQVFDEETLTELRDSIKEHGVVQPVVVRPATADGRYVLVLGERRLRASKMAGKDTIPALVRRLSPQQAAEMTVLENVVREDLNPLEQGHAFKVLSTEFHLTQAQIAERIGVSRETVANYMRLLRLPQKVMNYMLEDRLSFSDARELLRLENDQHIEQVADEIVGKRLKWDEIEERVMQLNGTLPIMPGQAGAIKKQAGARWMDPNVRAAQIEMERTLGMRVRIKDRNGKGKIVIEYASVDDYERVVEMLKNSREGSN